MPGERFGISPLALQFVKYGLCGILATVTQVVVFYLLVFTLFPLALDSAVPDGVRRNHAVLANLVAFPLSNTVAYVTNAIWVFTGGRHSRLREFMIFTGVSAVSFSAGLLGGPQLIQWFGISTHLAQASLIVSSAAVNFLARKFIVFRN